MKPKVKIYTHAKNQINRPKHYWDMNFFLSHKKRFEEFLLSGIASMKIRAESEFQIGSPEKKSDHPKLWETSPELLGDHSFYFFVFTRSVSQSLPKFWVIWIFLNVAQTFGWSDSVAVFYFFATFSAAMRGRVIFENSSQHFLCVRKKFIFQ